MESERDDLLKLCCYFFPNYKVYLFKNFILNS